MLSQYSLEVRHLRGAESVTHGVACTERQHDQLARLQVQPLASVQYQHTTAFQRQVELGNSGVFNVESPRRVEIGQAVDRAAHIHDMQQLAQRILSLRV